MAEKDPKTVAAEQREREALEAQNRTAQQTRQQQERKERAQGIPGSEVALKDVEVWVYFEAQDQMRKIATRDLDKITEPGFQVFTKEQDAMDYRVAAIGKKALRDGQKMRAKAKVERERAEFRKEHPELAGALERKSEQSIEEAERSVERAKAEEAARRPGTPLSHK